MQKIMNQEILRAPWQKIAEILNSSEFNVQGARERDGVVAAEYHLVDETAERKLFEIRTEEYRRTKTGSLDRTKTENSRTEYRWDAGHRTLAWSYISPPSTKMVHTSGVYTLRPVPEGTELFHEVSVEVDVPLVGNQFAKLIAKEFEKAFPGTIGKIRQRLSG